MDSDEDNQFPKQGGEALDIGEDFDSEGDEDEELEEDEDENQQPN